MTRVRVESFTISLGDFNRSAGEQAMNWILCGLPLVLLGALWGCLSIVAFDDANLIMVSIGGLYMFAGAFALTNRPASRALAMLAWIPVLFLFPLGTFFGIIAIRELRIDDAALKSVRKTVPNLPLTDIDGIVRQRATISLDLKDSQMDISMARDASIPPITINNFLDDLGVDYGLPISSNDRKLVETVNDVVDLLRTRLGNSET